MIRLSNTRVPNPDWGNGPGGPDTGRRSAGQAKASLLDVPYRPRPRMTDMECAKLYDNLLCPELAALGHLGPRAALDEWLGKSVKTMVGGGHD